MTFPLDKPKSLDEAVDLWNIRHYKQEDEYQKPV